MIKKVAALWLSLTIVFSFIIIIEIASVVEAPTILYVDDVPGSGGSWGPPEDYTSAYNFRLFGSFDHNVYLVSQASDDIIDTYTTGGTVNAVEISFAYHQSCYYYDYFVAGCADGYVYFFTYDYS